MGIRNGDASESILKYSAVTPPPPSPGTPRKSKGPRKQREQREYNHKKIIT
eukprot:UN01482